LRHHCHAVTHRIDYTGAAFLTCGTVSLLLFLSWGGTIYPWLSPMILTLAAVASLFYGLLIREERRACEPILPPHLFTNRVFVIAVIVIGLNVMALMGSLVFLPLFFQVVLGASPSRAGLMLAPMMGGVIFASITGGRLVSTFGRYKIFPVVGLAVCSVSFFALSMASFRGASVSVIEMTLILLGCGFGLVMPNLTVAMQNSVDRKDMGAATSALAFIRSLGGALGVAVAGAVVAIRLRQCLPASWTQPTASGSNLLELGVLQIAKLPLAQHALLMNAYRHAVGATFLTGATVAALAFAIVLFLPERPLRGAPKTELESPEETPDATY
jgi:Na+/melibiose symporter-like transporter